MTKNDREILSKLTDVISSLQTEMSSLKEEISELRKDKYTISSNENSKPIQQQPIYNYRIVYDKGYHCQATSMILLRTGIDYIAKYGRYYKIKKVSSEINSNFIDVRTDEWGSLNYDNVGYVLEL